MTTNEFFNEVETAQQNKLSSCIEQYDLDFELKPNQRIKKDKRTGILWLEEKERFYANGWHKCWVRIGMIEAE